MARDLRRVDDAELVRRFAAHRDRGERDAARAVWEQLVISNHDRVRTLVVAWRHPENPAVRIAPRIATCAPAPSGAPAVRW